LELNGLAVGPFHGPWWQCERFALNEGSRSLTMDGGFAVSKLMCEASEGDIGSLRWAIEPHSFCHSTADTTVSFSAMPTAPNETVVTCKWLVHKDAVEGVDYDVERLTELWTVTNLQDRDLVELNQRGVNSVGYVPGPYCREAESLVLRFVDWYCEKAEAFIAGRPEATTPDASRPITLDRAFAPARPSLPAISPDAS
jgi:Rieske 2Fe-2S family protein